MKLYYSCCLWYTNIRHLILRFWYWRKYVAEARCRSRIKENKQIQELIAVGEESDALIEECKLFYSSEKFKDVYSARILEGRGWNPSKVVELLPPTYESRALNNLTRETIEKSERGEDVKSFDTVEELFEDLDN